eukprot:g42.t1
MTEGEDGHGTVGESERVEGNGNHHLRKRLGLKDLILLGVGASIGAGIFVFTGIAARRTGPSVVLSFLVAALLCALDALAFAELAARYTESGGAYLYALKVFGREAALVVGVNLVFDYHIGAASIARSLASYMISLLHDAGLSWAPEWIASMSIAPPIISISIIAPVILFGLTAVLIRGIRESSKLNNALTVMKIGIIMFVVIVGAAHVSGSNYSPFFSSSGIGGMLTASSTVIFSYTGFDVICNTAEECVSPQRDMPLAILATLLICATLYGLLSAVLCGMVPFAEIDQSAPISKAFDGMGMNWAQIIIDSGASIGLTTSLLAGLYSQSRVYLAIGREFDWRKLAAIGASGTPKYATVLCGVLCSSFAALFDVEILSSMLSVGILISYSAACGAILKERVIGGDAESKLCVRYTAAISLFAFIPSALATLSVSVLVIILCSLPLVAMVSWTMLQLSFRKNADAAFSCPCVPAVPIAGLIANSIALGQRPWQAWARLCLLSFCAYYVGGRAQTLSSSFSENASLDYESLDQKDDDGHASS